MTDISKFNPLAARARMDLLRICSCTDQGDPFDPASWQNAATFDMWSALRAAMDGDMSGLASVPQDIWDGSRIETGPLPIETAPPGDGWILGLVAGDGAWNAEDQPWAILSRCDGGWMNDEGNRRTPTAWMPLPDPQPRPTGWAPVEGRIVVEEITGEGWTMNGQPVEVPYRWQVYIERSDGSYDEYREIWHQVTQPEAERFALKWQDKFGLPIAIAPLQPKAGSTVTLLHPERTRQ